jgi:hypothetical protein
MLCTDPAAKHDTECGNATIRALYSGIGMQAFMAAAHDRCMSHLLSSKAKSQMIGCNEDPPHLSVANTLKIYLLHSKNIPCEEEMAREMLWPTRRKFTAKMLVLNIIWGDC